MVVAAQRYRRNAHHFTYGTCPLCNVPGERLVTDHCHTHGWIRGQVCEGCNQRLRHEERRHSMSDLLAGLCWHKHRTAGAADQCRAAWRKANAISIGHYRRCPDCDLISSEPAR